MKSYKYLMYRYNMYDLHSIEDKVPKYIILCNVVKMEYIPHSDCNHKEEQTSKKIIISDDYKEDLKHHLKQCKRIEDIRIYEIGQLIETVDIIGKKEIIITEDEWFNQ